METTEYRTRAKKCSRQSELTTDTTVKLQWLSLAYEWRELADSLEGKGIYDRVNRAA